MDFLSIVNNIEDRETLVGRRGSEIVRNSETDENDASNAERRSNAGREK
jgi:hypothetical protein